jgi:hypothetical protein
VPDNPEDTWLSYYIPNQESVQKLKIKRKLQDLGQDDDVYDNVFHRDLDFKLVPSVYPFFLELRKDEGGAFYNPIQHHMVLKKRRVVVYF